MRIIHLSFSLDVSLELTAQSRVEDLPAYFVSKETFATLDKERYQPLLALLERNTQKHDKLRFSLLVSGVWLDLAEKYNPELIERLKKLLKLGRIELIAMPYYQSLAGFYDTEELTAQVRYFQDQAERLFGVRGRILALPGLTYNDEIAEWAELHDFAGMMVGDAQKTLDWRSSNHVYEAVSCKYLRLLFQNVKLSQLVADANTEIMGEKKISGSEETKMQLSVQKFQKLLELECLRGNLLNLYFGSEIFAKHKSAGIISFFDELMTKWLETPGNCFVGAAQACVAETPKVAVSVRGTVDNFGFEAKTTKASSSALAKAEVLPPVWYQQALPSRTERALFGFRREILASEDDGLIQDFRRLSAIDFALKMTDETWPVWQKLLDSLHERAETVKKAQAVEISRVYTKRREREVVDEDTAVTVNMTKKTPKRSAAPKPKAEPLVVKVVDPYDEEIDDEPDEIEEELADESVAEKPAQKSSAKPDKSKPRGIRKVIRKLVIE